MISGPKVRQTHLCTADLVPDSEAGMCGVLGMFYPTSDMFRGACSALLSLLEVLSLSENCAPKKIFFNILGFGFETFLKPALNDPKTPREGFGSVSPFTWQKNGV